MKVFFYSILIFLFLSSLAFSSGIIAVPPESDLGIDKVYLSVESFYENIEVREGIAHITIDEIFINPYDKTVEGIFLFPLPEGASVNKFSMLIDGASVQGEILEKDEARKIYENIVRKLVDPALLEYIGRNIYRASISPINPKSKVKVHIEFVYPLSRIGNTYYIVSPLSGLKYSKEPVKNIVITGNIEGSKDIVSLYSPIYPIESEINGNRAFFTVEKTNVKPDKDLLIYFSQDIKSISATLLTYEEETEDDGYFMFILSGIQRKKESSIPKDIVIVLDKSGSMKGEKLKQAKEALTFIAKRLGEKDRMRIITFSSNVRTLNPGWINGDDKKAVNNLISELQSINALGGTNIYSALSNALLINMRENAAHYVIFLTDGMPTVGIVDEKEIEKLVGDNIKDKRLFVFGIGDDVNLEFLTRLFRKGRGQGEFILSKNIEVSISSFYSKIEDPMLSNIQIIYPNIFYDVYPKDLQDLFWAQNLIILGRYEKGKAQGVDMKLRGDTSEGKEFYSFHFIIEPDVVNDFIPYLWAARKIGYLLEEVRLNGENKEIIDSIIELSKKYGIITPYTSSLVVKDKEAGKQPISAKHYLTQPVPQKREGVKYEQTLQNAGDMGFVSQENRIKIIGDRVFIWKDDCWVEEGYEGEHVNEIKMFSAKYFKLIEKDEVLREIFSLGEVIFKYKGNWVKIVK